MSQEMIQEEPAALGAFLRSQREQKGFTLSEATDSTKISPRVLEAIENDDYESMPADAFCRGFYTIYANFLELDKDEILARYQQQRGLPPNKKQGVNNPPVCRSKARPNYAEPAAFSPGFTISLILGIITFLLLCTFLYFGWNPLTFINNKIPSFNSSTQTEQIFPAADEGTEIQTGQPADSATLPETSSDQSTDSISGAEKITYALQVSFTSSGTLQVTLDNGFTESKQFFSGQTLEWQAKEEILLSLPETVSVQIMLNGVEVPLPAARNGKRLLSLPEALLDQ